MDLTILFAKVVLKSATITPIKEFFSGILAIAQLSLNCFKYPSFIAACKTLSRVSRETSCGFFNALETVEGAIFNCSAILQIVVAISQKFQIKQIYALDCKKKL